MDTRFRTSSRLAKPVLVGALLLGVPALGGCGAQVAGAPGGGATSTTTPPTTSTSTTGTSTTDTPAPPATPKRPTHFPHPDYHYQLTISSFGPLAGEPLTVTVRAGKVVSVVFAQDGRSGRKGEPIPNLSYADLTLDDIIAATRRPSDNPPQVDWPAGQAYPNRVSVDPIANAIDDEYSYAVASVVIDG